MLKIVIITMFGIYLSASDISSSLVEQQINESFITKFEYGKMLYNNPRGISCAKCHGSNGKGMIISTFKHKTKEFIYTCKIETKDITKISFEKFSAKLEQDNLAMEKIKFQKHQVCEKMIYGNTMPKYFLTKNEQDSIYYYITHVKEQQ